MQHCETELNGYVFAVKTLCILLHHPINETSEQAKNNNLPDNLKSNGSFYHALISPELAYIIVLINALFNKVPVVINSVN